ncbi:MAG: hypothetical protein P8M03_01175 [Flavobacteriaceae bacterium]|nr:hypothetical protein [Flavobacteriaceae bacterium]
MKGRIIFYILLVVNSYLFSQSDTPFSSYDFNKDLEYQKTLSEIKDIEIDKEGYKLLSDLAYQKKDHIRAIKFLQKRLELGERNVNIHYNIGGNASIIAKRNKNFKGIKYVEIAKYHFKKALELKENHIPSLVALAKLYIQLPNFLGGTDFKGRMYSNKLLKYDLIEGNLMNGFIFEINKNFDSAKEKYEKAFEIFKKKYSCDQSLFKSNSLRKNMLFELAEVSVRFNIHLDLSICLLKKFISKYNEEIFPKEWIYLRLAELYYKSGDKSKTNYYLNESLKINPNFNQARVFKQNIY